MLPTECQYPTSLKWSDLAAVSNGLVVGLKDKCEDGPAKAEVFSAAFGG